MFSRFISICKWRFVADELHSLLVLEIEPSLNATFSRLARDKLNLALAVTKIGAPKEEEATLRKTPQEPRS